MAPPGPGFPSDENPKFRISGISGPGARGAILALFEGYPIDTVFDPLEGTIRSLTYNG